MMDIDVGNIVLIVLTVVCVGIFCYLCCSQDGIEKYALLTFDNSVLPKSAEYGYVNGELDRKNVDRGDVGFVKKSNINKKNGIDNLSIYSGVGTDSGKRSVVLEKYREVIPKSVERKNDVNKSGFVDIKNFYNKVFREYGYVMDDNDDNKYDGYNYYSGYYNEKPENVGFIRWKKDVPISGLSLKNYSPS